MFNLKTIAKTALITTLLASSAYATEASTTELAPVTAEQSVNHSEILAENFASIKATILNLDAEAQANYADQVTALEAEIADFKSVSEEKKDEMFNEISTKITKLNEDLSSATKNS